MPTTVDELIQATRDQLDEANTANVTDPQLIQALNRAQHRAYQWTAIHYEDLAWAETDVTTTAGTDTYDIPAKAYGRRIEMVESKVNNISYKVQRISNHKKSNYSSNSQVTRPYYYSIIKNKIQLFPSPGTGNTITVHYARRPENLQTNQGRIETIDTTSSYFLVDSLGSDISALTTGFNSYINVIDYTTGEIKESYQIAAIDTDLNKIEIKTAGLTRSSVLGNTISSSITTSGEATPVVDDYFAIVTGTCVPELPEFYTDYLIQYAVVEIRRRFSENIIDEKAHLKELEEEIKNMWAGREQSHRVAKRSKAFGRGYSSFRRYFS